MLSTNTLLVLYISTLAIQHPEFAAVVWKASQDEAIQHVKLQV